MRIQALSDLHVGHSLNRESVDRVAAHPDDWLILCGDVGESLEHLAWTLGRLVPRFRRVVWVPGNHELWTTNELRGVAKYDALVALCRAVGVLTPEDPYEELEPGLFLVPLFLLYDYSFSPDALDPAGAVRWAAEAGIVCADESRLSPEPWPTRQDWCDARLRGAEARLAELPTGARTVLVNHWPLRLDLCRLFRIPRFTPWCGTRRTEDWHVRYRAELVVSGHLHMRATDWRDGVRFEEVSLGYPRQYDPEKGAPGYLRQVWPATVEPPGAGFGGPDWHR